MGPSKRPRGKPTTSAVEQLMVNIDEADVKNVKETGGPAALAPSAALRSYSGADVVNSARGKKEKLLIMLPGSLSLGRLPKGGRIGELCGVNTPAPALYIEFPEGRLKLTGRKVHTRSRFLPLTAEKGGMLSCKSVVDSMLLLSVANWVGKKEENPEELPLALPEGISKEVSGTEGIPELRSHWGGGNPDWPLSEYGYTEQEKAPAAAKSSSLAKKGSKRDINASLSYAESSESDEMSYEGEEDDSEDEEVVEVLTETPKSVQRKKGRGKRNSTPGGDASNDSGSDEAWGGTAVAPTTPCSARSSSRKKPRQNYRIASEDEEDEEEELDESESDE